MLSPKGHHDDIKKIHLEYTEKNCGRLRSLFSRLQFLGLVVSHSTTKRFDFEIERHIPILTDKKIVSTSLNPQTPRGHFVTEEAIARGVQSLNNRLLLIADLIKKSETFKEFRHHLKSELSTPFLSGCVKRGFDNGPKYATMAEQKKHNEMSQTNLMLIQTSLSRIDFFKGFLDSNKSWKKIRQETQENFPSETQMLPNAKTILGSKYGLSLQDRLHFDATLNMKKKIASIDHRITDMIVARVHMQQLR